MEELRQAGSRTMLEISARANRDKELEPRQKHRNTKNSVFKKNTKYRHCVVTAWDVMIEHQCGGHTR